MRKKITGCIIFLTFAALMSGGCAKKDVVKTDEQIPVTQPAPSTPTERETIRPVPRDTVTPSPADQRQIPETPTSEQRVQPDVQLQPGTQRDVGQAGDLQSDLESALDKIYFNFNSADLSDEARSTLSKNAELLSGQPSVKIRIEGHCDERGSDDYNMALGERRAKAARDYLVNLGIQPDRISTISYGEEKPADPGSDEEAWARNRRDEFIIVR